jgi:hypothetical protein
MPINIYNRKDSSQELAWLCDNDWELPSQVYELEKWLIENQSKILKGEYVADIGFDIRKDALGGGGIISLEMMRIMLDLGMEIYLSEYPETNKEP